MMRCYITRTSMRMWGEYDTPPVAGAVRCPSDERPDGNWCIDIDTLEGLMAFSREHGELVVYAPKNEGWYSMSRYVEPWPVIEIYDGYRE